MPAQSKAQYRFMAYCNHLGHSKKECPKRSIAMEFTHATKDVKSLPERKAPLEERMTLRG